MTLRELLYRELHGAENLREQEIKSEVVSCINEDFDFFVGTERVEAILESMDTSLPYFKGINKSIGFLKVWENKVLNEEKITKQGAKILAHDIMSGLRESVASLEGSVRFYNKADKDKLSKIYSTLLFETQEFGERFGLDIGNVKISSDELKKLIETDFMYIAEEVL